MDTKEKNKDFEDLQAENLKLKQELEFYKAALNALPNPIFVKNNEAEFIFFNAAYESFFGINSDELIGTKVIESKYLDDKDKFRYHVEDITLLETQTTIKYQVPFALASGDIVPSLYWSCGFATADNARGLIGEIVAIKQIREREEMLIQSAIRKENNAEEEKIIQLNEDIKQFFRTIINYYDGERVFVLEFDYIKNKMNALLHLTKDESAENYQEFVIETKLSAIGNFLGRLTKNSSFYADRETIKQYKQIDFTNLAQIDSLIYTPLFGKYSDLLGIMVVTNPKSNVDKLEIIQSTAPFVVEDITKTRNYENLLKKS